MSKGMVIRKVTKWETDSVCCEVMKATLRDKTITVEYGSVRVKSELRDETYWYVNYCPFCGLHIEKE